jgi:glycosyltransferase involved in cell wall biosynthesis
MKILLSTVTPVYKGKLYIEALVRSLAKVHEELKAPGCPIELTEAIFVVDDARDGSVPILGKLQETFPWVRVIHLSNNFGQHPATMAGILFAVGDWIVTLDEDLQHDPHQIQTLIEQAAKSGMDIIYGTSLSTIHGRRRDHGSKFAKKLIGWISKNPHIVKFSSFRLVRGDIGRAAAALASSNTYFDVALTWFTNRIGTYSMPLSDPTIDGSRESGYSLRDLLNHFVRLAVTSGNQFLRVGAIIGGVSFVTSIVFGMLIFLVSLLYPDIISEKGWTSLVLINVFFGGLISIMVGIGLEYIGNLYDQSQGKPTFFVIDRKADEVLIKWFESRST